MQLIYVNLFKKMSNMEKVHKIKRIYLKLIYLCVYLQIINKFIPIKNIVHYITNQLRHLRDKMIFSHYLELYKAFKILILKNLHHKVKCVI